MKKRAMKLTALLLAGVLLAGCSSAQQNDKKQSSSSQKTVIEYWHVNAETQGGQTVDELVRNFNKSNDKIEVVAKYNPDMYKGLMQNLQAENAAGNAPALVQIGWAFLDYFSNNFPYTSPSDAISKFDADNKTFLSDNFLPNILKLAVNSEGKQVGIPYSLSTPVLYINKDILKEAGLNEDGPETWEDVVSFAETIKKKTGKYGFYMQEPSDFWAQQALIESSGASMLTTDKSGKVQASFASEKGITAFKKYADMIADKSALHIGWEEGCQSFIDGNVGMLYTTIARRSSVQGGAKFDVATVKSPVWEGQERKIPAGGCFLAITAQKDDQIKAAWEFEKYLYSIESMAEWTKGTGYVPPRTGVEDSEKGLKGFLAENKMMNAAIEQMDGVVPWTSFPGDVGLQAEQLLIDMRDQILGGSVDAADGMKNTQDQINTLLRAQE